MLTHLLSPSPFLPYFFATFNLCPMNEEKATYAVYGDLNPLSHIGLSQLLDEMEM
jgi:hypothetical protein